MWLAEDMDPRTQELIAGPLEDLVEIQVDKDQPARMLKIAKNLYEEVRMQLTKFLLDNL